MTFHKKNLVVTLLFLMVMALGGTKAFLDQRLDATITQWLTSTWPRFAAGYHAEYATASFSLLGSVVISKLKLTHQHQTFDIEQLLLKNAYQLYRLNVIPQQLQLILHQVHWTVHDQDSTIPVLLTLLGYAAYAMQLKEFSQLGYTQADVYLSVYLEENQGSLAFKIVETSGNILSVTVKAQCAHCTLAQGVHLKSSLNLTAIIVDYSDQGLFEKVAATLAKRQSVNIATFKQTLITRLSHDLRQPPLTLEPQALEQLRQFIETPKNISLQLRLTPPLPIKQLETMNLGKRQFTLSIVTN